MVKLYGQRRSFALLDYISGTTILVGAVMGITSLHITRANTLSFAHQRQLARYEVNSSLSDARRRLDSDKPFRAKALAAVQKAKGQWVDLATAARKSDQRLGSDSSCLWQARSLEGMDPRLGFELSAKVSWLYLPGDLDSLHLTTIYSGGE
jgi:hypothetical protein